MIALRLAPVVLALVVLGAHCYRAGAWLPLAIVAALLVLLSLRRRCVPWLVQLALLVGALEWVRTTIELVAFRQSAGLAWIRMAAILATVALATLLAALVMRQRALRAYYEPAPVRAIPTGGSGVAVTE